MNRMLLVSLIVMLALLLEIAVYMTYSHFWRSEVSIHHEG